MLERTTRLWICSLILALLGQLGWAAAMPLPAAATGHTAIAHEAHSSHGVQSPDSQHAGSEHCTQAPNHSDTGNLGGHACCPFVGLAPSPAWPLPVNAPQRYGPAIADASHDGVASAIFKPPKR